MPVHTTHTHCVPLTNRRSKNHMTRCACTCKEWQLSQHLPGSIPEFELLNRVMYVGKTNAWCTSCFNWMEGARPEKGCSGLERAWALLALLLAGPFGVDRVVSPVGVRSQTAVKQAFDLTYDLFPTSWRVWLGLLCFLPVLSHWWLSKVAQGLFYSPVLHVLGTVHIL